MYTHQMYSSPKSSKTHTHTHTSTHPHTTTFIMRKHSVHTSENLWLLINHCITEWASSLPTCAFSAVFSGTSASPYLVISRWYLYYIIQPFTPLAPFPKADITPRHNVRVITINLYDRFASHRAALRVIYHVKWALGKAISLHRDDTYFLFAKRRIRAIVQATNQIRPACGITNRLPLKHETTSKNNDGRYANTMLGFCYESMRSLN